MRKQTIKVSLEGKVSLLFPELKKGDVIKLKNPGWMRIRAVGHTSIYDTHGHPHHREEIIAAVLPRGEYVINYKRLSYENQT